MQNTRHDGTQLSARLWKKSGQETAELEAGLNLSYRTGDGVGRALVYMCEDALCSIITAYNGVVVHACTPSTREVRQGQKFKVIINYMGSWRPPWVT